jgi:hypothetical protein
MPVNTAVNVIRPSVTVFQFGGINETSVNAIRVTMGLDTPTSISVGCAITTTDVKAVDMGVVAKAYAQVQKEAENIITARTTSSGPDVLLAFKAGAASFVFQGYADAVSPKFGLDASDVVVAATSGDVLLGATNLAIYTEHTERRVDAGSGLEGDNNNRMPLKDIFLRTMNMFAVVSEDTLKELQRTEDELAILKGIDEANQPGIALFKKVLTNSKFFPLSIRSKHQLRLHI